MKKIFFFALTLFSTTLSLTTASFADPAQFLKAIHENTPQPCERFKETGCYAMRLNGETPDDSVVDTIVSLAKNAATQACVLIVDLENGDYLLYLSNATLPKEAKSASCREAFLKEYNKHIQ